ncbi:metalloregulator ArsR/SmtB family transcription factor [Candidatus Bipolaricaulota bacterium]|nr:metalloregulator ArsR/SmtB family transcription factor [Candidatus Bipolaricaulota bacterium]
MTCQRVAEFIGVLANPYRVGILCCLSDQERSVGEIARIVDLPPAHVSAHLRVLYDRGYLERRREWKQVFYALRDPAIQALLDGAAGLVSGRPSRPL